jgi:hypothetical protein
VCVCFPLPGHELATENSIAARFVSRTVSFSLDTELQLKQTEKEFHVQAKELLFDRKKKLKSYRIEAENHHKLKKNPSMFQVY